MAQISPKAVRISTLILGLLSLLTVLSVKASMSVYHKGNPKKYELNSVERSDWKITPLKKEGKLTIKDGLISLEGADLKGGVFNITSKKFGKGTLTISDAFLGKGGVFNSKGTLKLKGKEKELFFDVNLEPIKRGFVLSSKIKFAQEDFDLKLYKKNKKRYDDVVFSIKVKLLEK